MWPQGKKPHITLVDQSDRFTFKPLLYELLNGTAQAGEVAPTFTQLLAPYPIQFVQDKVLVVEPEQLLQDGGSAGGGNITLASGQSLAYDWLVVSLGAAADPRGVPGVREFATPFVTLEDAEFVAGRLAAFEARAAVGQPKATVVVVGAGYAGVELASVVGERLQGKAQVLLVTPGTDILETAPAGQREAARQALQSCGVTLVTGSKVTAVEEQLPAVAIDLENLYSAAATSTSTSTPFAASPVLAAAVVQSGESASDTSTSMDPVYIVKLEPAGPTSFASNSASDVPADLVLWTAGSRPVSRPLQPFPTDPRGQLQTDATLRVQGHSRVFALGDVSQGQPETSSSGSAGNDGTTGRQVYPATAQVAFQQADYAAWNIWSAINGRSLLPFRYQHLGDMMSLGAANAAVALPLQLPPQISTSINSSPLGPLLAAAGIKLTSQQQRQQQSEAAAGITLEGPLAQLLRRAAYLYRQPTQEQRLQVAASWLNQAADAAARLAAEAGSANNSGRPGS
eukprot:gene5705-5945_t